MIGGRGTRKDTKTVEGEPGGPVPPPASQGRHERGIALLLVLWLLVLLSVMALSFSGTARIQARIARNLQDNAQARWIADAGVRLAVRDLWAANSASQPALDGEARFCRFRSGTLAIAIQDVSGLIDLNTASGPILENLFIAAGAADDDASRLAAAVADFRDADDNPRPNGAEAQAYAAAGLTYGPKNSAFQTVDEMEQVLGMSPALFKRIRTAVTVYSQRPDADLRTAPPLVRRAYGQKEGAVPTDLPYAQTPFTAQGVFAVTVTVQMPSGAYFVREAVLALHGGRFPSYRVLHWSQAPDRTLASMPDRQSLDPC